LKDLSIVGDQAYRLNFESARIAKKAADEVTAKSGMQVDRT